MHQTWVWENLKFSFLCWCESFNDFPQNVKKTVLWKCFDLFYAIQTCTRLFKNNFGVRKYGCMMFSWLILYFLVIMSLVHTYIFQYFVNSCSLMYSNKSSLPTDFIPISRSSLLWYIWGVYHSRYVTSCVFVFIPGISISKNEPKMP